MLSSPTAVVRYDVKERLEAWAPEGQDYVFWGMVQRVTTLRNILGGTFGGKSNVWKTSRFDGIFWTGFGFQSATLPGRDFLSWTVLRQPRPAGCVQMAWSVPCGVVNRSRDTWTRTGCAYGGKSQNRSYQKLNEWMKTTREILFVPVPVNNRLYLARRYYRLPKCSLGGRIRRGYCCRARDTYYYYYYNYYYCTRLYYLSTKLN